MASCYCFTVTADFSVKQLISAIALQETGCYSEFTRPAACVMPKQLTIAQVQQQHSNLPGELTDEPIVITQDGVPVMAALSYTDLTELLETLDILTDTEFAFKFRQSILQAEKGSSISWESAKATLGL
jgi:PHD/YefM family antitoxin component YafN of YafNO toxin-antitoxin module